MKYLKKIVEKNSSVIIVLLCVVVVLVLLRKYNNSKKTLMDYNDGGIGPSNIEPSYPDTNKIEELNVPSILEDSSQEVLGNETDYQFSGNNEDISGSPYQSSGIEKDDLLPNGDKNVKVIPYILPETTKILKNANLQLREDVHIPKQDIGPWGNSTQDENKPRKNVL